MVIVIYHRGGRGYLKVSQSLIGLTASPLLSDVCNYLRGSLKVFKILVDTDLILDSLMNRCEFAEDVRFLLDKVHPSIQLYLTNVGLQKIYSYTHCLKKRIIPDIVNNWLQQKTYICVVNPVILKEARYSDVKDFESAVELVCVNYYQLDAIVTNRQADFREAGIKSGIWSFQDLWLRANLENQLQTILPS